MEYGAGNPAPYNQFACHQNKGGCGELKAYLVGALSALTTRLKYMSWPLQRATIFPHSLQKATLNNTVRQKPVISLYFDLV